jgi:hypothetical protein
MLRPYIFYIFFSFLPLLPGRVGGGLGEEGRGDEGPPLYSPGREISMCASGRAISVKPNGR